MKMVAILETVEDSLDQSVKKLSRGVAVESKSSLDLKSNSHGPETSSPSKGMSRQKSQTLHLPPRKMQVLVTYPD